MAELLERPLKVAEDHYLLKIQTGDTEAARPGQFINIRVSEGTDPLVRRPFSVYNRKKDILEIIIQVVGKGTSILCSAEPGPLDILGPLGQGFSLIEKGSALLVGGGVGNAPLYFLARELKEKGVDVSYLYGSRSKDHIYCADAFGSVADTFRVSTDDGSTGHHGFVTALLEDLLKEKTPDMVYTCGPTPMMAEVSRICGSAVPVEVSLENYFGCGIGLCVGCTVETEQGFKRACVDGPVMDGSLIKWDSLTH